MPVRPLLEKIEILNRRHHFFAAGDSLVVGVSGGGDSAALLYLLSKIQRKHRLKIAVAHLDHGIRPADSRRYERTARKIAETFEYPYFSKKIRALQSAKKMKRSLEEAGRIERYHFFKEIARKIKASKIVTAHTLDDQAETVLMKILRGAGLRGLSGIHPKRKEGGVTVIRPLLLAEKKELVRLLKKTRLPFCTDPTNRDTAFMRNRIRHELLPLLVRRFNPKAKEALAALEAASYPLQDYLDKLSEKAFSRATAAAGRNRVVLKLDRLQALHPALKTEVLFRALRRIRGDGGGLGYAHMAGILDGIQNRSRPMEWHLPGFIRVRKNARELFISRRSNASSPVDTPSKSGYNRPIIQLKATRKKARKGIVSLCRESKWGPTNRSKRP